MKWLLEKLFRPLFVAFSIMVTASTAHAMCTPKFLNPATDICWSCMFPIVIFNQALYPDRVERADQALDPVCTCGLNVGIPVTFSEPVRSVDVVKSPYCFLNLGFELDTDTLPFDPIGGVHIQPNAGTDHSTKSSFYHIHYYTNPMLYWLELLLDDACIERGGFDLAFLSEADPTWSDPQLSGILNPDAFLYGNPVAVAACSADCIAATTFDNPVDVLHWCAGCQGTVYPMTGKMVHHYSGVASASVLMQRLLTKMHRIGLMFGTTGEQALCSYYPQFLIKKSDYKFQITHPFPQDKGLTGKCCQALGSSSALYEPGKNLPVVGEDFGMTIFRKRDCCNAFIKGIDVDVGVAE